MTAPSLAPLFEQLAAAVAPHLRDALAQAFAALGAGVDEARLAQAVTLAHGDPAKLEAVLGLLLDDATVARAFAPVREALHAALANGAEAMAHGVDGVLAAAPAPGTPGTPNAPNEAPRVALTAASPRVTAAAQAVERELFASIPADVRAGARQLVADAVAQGKGPAEAARAVRPLLGLTEYQAKVVANFRAELAAGHAGALDRALRDKRFDRTVQKAVDGTTTLTPEQIDRMTDAYGRGILQQTASNFAETEGKAMMKRAQLLGWDEAIGSGAVDGADLVRTWHTNLDGHERPGHRAMNGVTVAYDEPYDVPDAGPEMYPGEGEHGCRCSQLIRPRWVAALSTELRGAA